MIILKRIVRNKLCNNISVLWRDISVKTKKIIIDNFFYLFYKQPVYKQLVLERKIAKNISVVRYVK